MKINPDDPWYPNPYKLDDRCSHDVLDGCPACRGVPLRLKLAVEMTKSLAWFPVWFGDQEPINVSLNDFLDAALKSADTMIERANCDEGSDDDV